MALKTIEVKIEAEGRDKGKVFLITEMPARRAEKWAARAFLALAKNGINIPPDIENAGLAGLFSLGISILGKLPWVDAEELMDEMFTCIQIKPSPTIARPLIDRGTDGDDIEEVATRANLRGSVIELHTGFSIAAELSKLRSDSAAVPSSSNTRTSRVSSAR